MKELTGVSGKLQLWWEKVKTFIMGIEVKPLRKEENRKKMQDSFLGKTKGGEGVLQ